MKNQTSDLISSNSFGRLPIFDLINQGKLGEYLCFEWKRINGWDPRFVNNLLKYMKLVEKMFYGITIIGLVFLTYHINRHDLSWKIAGIATSIFAIGFGGMFLIALKCPDIEQWVLDFERAVSWLLQAIPMDSSTFPKDISDLETVYRIAMVDMAKFVTLLEGCCAFYAIKSAAKTNLNCLFDGAQRFGFVRDRKKGLKPYFNQAHGLKKFVMFNEADWVQRHDDWIKRIIANGRN